MMPLETGCKAIIINFRPYCGMEVTVGKDLGSGFNRMEGLIGYYVTTHCWEIDQILPKVNIEDAKTERIEVMHDVNFVPEKHLMRIDGHKDNKEIRTDRKKQELIYVKN